MLKFIKFFFSSCNYWDNNISFFTLLINIGDYTDSVKATFSVKATSHF